MYKFKVATVLEEERTTQILIDGIKSWMEEERLPDMPEEMVALFLISCDNEVEATRNTITSFLQCKKDAPEVFDDRDIDRDDLTKALKVIQLTSIPVRTDNNDVIHFFRLQDTNYQHFELLPSVKLSHMILDVSQNKPSPPDGLIVLVDMKGSGFMHLTHFRLDVARQFLHFIQEALPLKIHGIHVLNANFVFYRALAIVKYWVKADILKMIKCYPVGYNHDEFLKEAIPAKCMPKDYGGLLPTFDELHQETINQFRELKPFHDAEEKMRKSARDDL